MTAIQGWLVFEPNYRGIIEYGDEFVNEIQFQIMFRPGKDILVGVNHLVADGIANPYRLTIGGFNYDEYLTN
ncbi:unnamed protein product [Rotaria sp. Silwood1]|nr:unnamed protein product [Rotaria sp. Silwood1]CAF3540185.1 unnamed protein product [Rotaria sp. Silwood1]CAF4856341.1 unnamed protein product [Rotaria sp. Silwood1]CAF4940621.1 unnamed protein product [Rotaria sp. Silwood1]